MNHVGIQHMWAWAALVAVLMPGGVYSRQANQNEANEPPVMILADEARKIVHLAEAVRWPTPASLEQYMTKAKAKEKDSFMKAVGKTIDPNLLPENLCEKLVHLNGWPAANRRTYILDYNKAPYRIRLKNQETHVQAEERRFTSYWITLIIQMTDKSRCVENVNLTELLRFTDRFLSRQLSSTAQDYTNVTDLHEPVFEALGSGHLAAYPLNASEPPMDGVAIYTDGRTVVINLQERRKVVEDQQRRDPLP